MIFASLTDSATYAALSPRFAAAFDFCRRVDLRTLPLGRHDVQGDDVFALLQENPLKPESACRWEAHRTYADIQLVLTGTECMGVVPLAACEPESPFDPAADVGFFRLTRPPAQKLTLPEGHFAIFFPHDAHMPLIAPAGSEGAVVRKVVFKVRVG
jgi:YhcH/YjgK/YiaL family protein